MDDYFIEHESWGSAVRPRFTLELELGLDLIDVPGIPFPVMAEGPWYGRPQHRCPLTETRPGEAMGYACPVCSGANC